MLGAVLAGALMAISAEASADNKFCYWNAEGLPYSKAPPPDAGEPLFPGGPMQAILAIFNASPQLVYQQACGLITEIDLVKPREIYRRWGCSPDSSVGQMVEGLASGGVFVLPGMSFVEYVTKKYEDEFAEHCPLLEGIEPICFLVSGESPNPKDVERYPQCFVGVWQRVRDFEEFWGTIGRLEREKARELVKRDQDLLESAGIEAAGVQ